MCARVGESDRVEQRWDHGSEPSIAAYRIHQIEDEQRIALFQGVKVVEVEIDGYNLGGKAELGKRAHHGLGGKQCIDLVWSFARRGMHDGNEAAWL